MESLTPKQPRFLKSVQLTGELHLLPVSCSGTAAYAFMERLLLQSFPPDERRPEEALRQLTDCPGLFRNNIICHLGHYVGLFTYWEFKGFNYVEHFAISPSFRSAGHGAQALQAVCAKWEGKPVVLEVEPPADPWAVRRIAFYRRLGFVPFAQDYLQPPYRPGQPHLPLILMARNPEGRPLPFREVCTEIWRHVYSVG